jgi:hypothetical protein
MYWMRSVIVSSHNIDSKHITINQLTFFVGEHHNEAERLIPVLEDRTDTPTATCTYFSRPVSSCSRTGILLLPAVAQH